jgi:hypothetical protein
MLPDTIKTRGLHAFVRFAPRAPLDKQHKQQFLMRASEGFDWRRQEFAEQAWTLMSPQSDGDARSLIKLSVFPDTVSFEDQFPTGSLEMFFDNLRLALEGFASVFDPKVMLASGILVRLTAQSEAADARVYLGQQCLHLDERLKALERPVHAVGLKLLLPPLPGKDQPNWQAEIKIESLVEDIRQLFVEVDARWGNPAAWEPKTVVERVKTAHEFATKQVVAFLQQLARDEGPPR